VFCFRAFAIKLDFFGRPILPVSACIIYLYKDNMVLENEE